MSVSLNYIDDIIGREIKDFSDTFLNDYTSGSGKKKVNVINKKNNIFIAALGDDITVYSALMRSLDSSLGNRIEKIAKEIAKKNYIVEDGVEGYMPTASISAIADLLDSYHNHTKHPEPKDIELVYRPHGDEIKTHEVSDYFLTLKSDPRQKFLIELKIGGDLDNKKAESEKRALLQQYVILRNSNKIRVGDTIKIYFCTAYNKYGEEALWKQERVRQFFCDDEIKIGKDFWNFFCTSPDGYATVKKSYIKHSHHLKSALKKIVEHYSTSN